MARTHTGEAERSGKTQAGNRGTRVGRLVVPSRAVDVEAGLAMSMRGEDYNHAFNLRSYHSLCVFVRLQRSPFIRIV
jgi:hypothetical protein